MTNTQVSTARKFATAAFAGFVALSLMVPTQLAFAEYYVGDDPARDGAVDDNGEGSESGTWDYEADGQEMTLTDYVGGTIRARDQNLNIQLEGDNTVNGSVSVTNGDLTIKGDSSVYGLDKPSLTVSGTEIGDGSTSGGIGATGDVTIEDANIYFDSTYGGVYGYGELTVQDSAIWRGDANESLSIWNYELTTGKAANMLFKGSEINATSVYTDGELTIDNTNLTVLPNKYAQEAIDAGTYGDTPWVKTAVTAIKGITLKGESNGEVMEYTNEAGQTYYYLYTGDDNKVELKASATPAYWGPQGMPKTGDALPLAGLGIIAVFAGIAGAYSLRKRAEEK